ncbi:MAG: metalloregulator ArsR/SmtB family transcription factor [Chromatiales bacterium]|nr:metalloregulator ArsR/SmtB family transcription factor [Chromatiales bacterium]
MNQEFHHQLYGQFARVGKAVSNGHRIALLDLLAQGERSVEALAQLAGLSLANTSQHLQLLRGAGLVKARKQGQHVFYRLTDDLRIGQLLETVQLLAQDALAEVGPLMTRHLGADLRQGAISATDLHARLDEVTLLDLRPAEEFARGHVPTARNLPLRELDRQLHEIPRARPVVVYCRGALSPPAFQAAQHLESKGFRVQRLARGFPEWRLAGLPIEVEDAMGAVLA